jgi:hypothetical protein
VALGNRQRVRDNQRSPCPEVTGYRGSDSN